MMASMSVGWSVRMSSHMRQAFTGLLVRLKRQQVDQHWGKYINTITPRYLELPREIEVGVSSYRGFEEKTKNRLDKRDFVLTHVLV